MSNETELLQRQVSEWKAEVNRLQGLIAFATKDSATEGNDIEAERKPFSDAYRKEYPAYKDFSDVEITRDLSPSWFCGWLLAKRNVAALAAPQQEPVAINGDKAFDDSAVDQFADAMKAKLDKKRIEGRSGWHDRSILSQKQLSNMLLNHVDKGDPVDVGNFAMMLFMRQEKIVLPADPIKPNPNGYAYEYPGRYGGIQFTKGEERNGSQPIRAIPYFFDAPPPPAPTLSDENITMHWDILVSRKDPAQSFEGLVIDFARALLAMVTRP